MRLVNTEEMIQISLEQFAKWAEPLACSFMYGEVPTSSIIIHRTGSYDHDWLTKVRFKNSVSISMFRCEIYLDDIIDFCKRCHIWLITKEIFRLAITFCMLYPLYQTQYMNFKEDGVETAYQTMITEAGKDTYDFMTQYYPFHDPLEKLILDIFFYESMHIIQTYKYFPEGLDYTETISKLILQYEKIMKKSYKIPYRTAQYRKAQDCLINEEGYMLIEYVDQREIKYDEDMELQQIPQEVKEELVHVEQKEKRKRGRPRRTDTERKNNTGKI